MPPSSKAKIAILIPCYNEAHAIAGVVRGFQSALPQAQIYVYDNNSSDNTAKISTKAQQGNVVRRIFNWLLKNVQRRI